MIDDAFDDVLERFARTGPEFGPGLSNHGPMAVDALVAMGRPDALAAWADWYLPRLSDPPESRHPIDAASWREALGDIGRVGDWTAFFENEMRDAAWTDALETWVPRLTPGIMAGATHGMLRTAHAVRALERGPTPRRVAELAEGLAYWAARYQTLPTATARLTGTPLRVAEAIKSVPLVPDDKRSRGMIFDAVRAVSNEGFAPVIDLVDVDGDAGAFISEITGAFVRHYLANARAAGIGFIHTVTAPSALRILAPHLSPEARRDAMRYAWQACASIYSAYGTLDAPQTSSEPVGFDAADLIDQAVAARDEHAIKFTEACLREYAISQDGAFIVAARDAVGRLKR